MKRLLALFLCFSVMLSCLSLSAFAADSKTLLFEVSIDGKNEIIVNAGDRITVDFTVENISDDAGYSITNLQNEIEFDDDFFEFTEGDVELVTAYFSRYADDYSWGAKRVQILARHIDGGKPKAYEDKQLVARVTFKVKDGLAEGTSGKLENKVCEAAEAISGVTYTTSSKGMTVYIGNAVEEKYTVTYKNGNTIVNTDNNAAAGSKINIYSAPTAPQGKKFAGWKDPGGTLWQPGNEYTVTKDVTFTAVWYDKHTLRFETNGGSEIADKIAWENESIDLTQYIPSKNGYTFDGWYSDEELKFPVSSVSLDKDTTVYAKWEKTNSNTGGSGTMTNYTLSFETNGGSAVEKVSKSKNATVDLSEYTTKKEGYTFDGWYTDKELTNKVTEIKMSSDVTLYAKWTIENSSSVDNPNYKPDILSDEHYAYINGSEDGLIYPQRNLTRAEAATIFFRLLAEDVRKEGLTNENAFDDVSSNDWFNTAVSTLTKLGILQGRTLDTFAPNDPITRAEFTTIVARLSQASYTGEDLFTDIEKHWAKDYINTAASINWVVGENGLFRPNDNITRAEVMALVNRVLNRQPETTADLIDGMIVWADNTNEDAWYYIDVQEATNSHDFEIKDDGIHEKWTKLTENPDWTTFEK